MGEMLEERYKELGRKRDYTLRGFGESDGVPGFWCRRGEYNNPLDCLRQCGACLSCGEKFAPIRAHDQLDRARFDWGLMVLTGEIKPPFGDLGILPSNLVVLEARLDG